jgi:hypothetical protein
MRHFYNRVCARCGAPAHYELLNDSVEHLSDYYDEHADDALQDWNAWTKDHGFEPTRTIWGNIDRGARD